MKAIHWKKICFLFFNFGQYKFICTRINELSENIVMAREDNQEELRMIPFSSEVRIVHFLSHFFLINDSFGNLFSISFYHFI